MIGKKLGAYEIVAKLGEGGMGDVYKALDTRLDRTVAIKIVRTDFSERFEREARSVSALNHPNICTLHDVGEQDDVAFLVMEFVDGAPIAGPLPVADVIRDGIQICEALEAAHKKGIVHRDLKPANIMATRAGIKLLDFGLAKLQPAAPNAAGNQATVAALTGAHTIVGTPQYMAPEQIEGREADARTDIFALGCVLYELITGKRAFDGKSASSIMAAVLATEPRKISELVPLTPPTLEWVVQRCLEKDPDARWQSARDVALQLKWIGEHPDHSQRAAAPSHQASSRRALLGGLALGIAVAGIAAAAWISMASRPGGRPSPTPASVSLSLTLPADASLSLTGTRQASALSPDGRAVAFAAVTKTAAAIFLRPLDSFEAVRVDGTEGGSGPFFSPDGRWLAFWAGGHLKKIPVGGGAPVVICDAPALRGAAWLADDTIVFTRDTTGPLMRVSSHGGATPTLLTKLDDAQNEKTHRTLIGLPGGKAVVFVIGSNEIGTYDEASIVALTLATGQITELVKGGYAPAYSPTGHLLYVNHSSVFALPFDPGTLKMSGSPVEILKDVASLPDYGVAEYDVAPSGALIFAPGGDRSPRNELRWIDRAGNVEPMPAERQRYLSIDMSHDGRRLAVQKGGANNVLFAYDIVRNQWTRLTFRRDIQAPVWKHDDSHVTYWSGADVRSVPADGSGAEEVLVSASQAAGRQVFPESWSGDGQTLSVTLFTPGKGTDVGLYSVREKRLTPIVESRFDEIGGQLSPDGRWLAYVSNESGREQVYVRAVEGSGGKLAVSSDGGASVRWTSNGRELVYANEKGVMAVSFTPGPQPSLGKPGVLFGPGAVTRFIDRLSPSPDGSRFAAVFEIPYPPIKEIRVVTNWSPAR
jgi:serine/threonine-protein kinase